VVLVVVGGSVVVLVVVGGSVVVLVVVGGSVVVLVVVVGRGRRGPPHRLRSDQFHVRSAVHSGEHVVDTSRSAGEPAIGGNVSVAQAATEPNESMVVRTTADV
jgi:hypothetical protein